MDPAAYGDAIADVYDDWYGDVSDVEGTVETIAALAGGGPVLELGIGTGRLALPLAAHGLEVHGIDASDAMVAKLRGKPGGTDIPVTIGDFADVPTEGAYPLVYVPFNTFFALLSQEEQVRCFRNVAAHLTEDGVFVMDVFVPDMTRFDRGQRVETNRLELDLSHLTLSVHDPVEQRIKVNIVHIEEGAVKQFPVQLRYAWPSELDLMARLGGLQLRERWSSWDRDPFTAASQAHVSVYERARGS
jgi:SAM-dependent methyltransferase